MTMLASDPTEEPWSVKARQRLAEKPELGYRAMHAELQKAGYEVALKKVQKFMVQCRLEKVGDGSKAREQCNNGTLGADSLEQVELPGKGAGILAKHVIPVGSLIMLERPVILSDDEAKLDILLNSLTDDKKVDVLSLHSDYPEENDIVGIWRTNSIPCPRAGVTSDAQSERGLFFQISRLNHSCSPNAMQSWVETTRQMQVRAVREIEAGEEICLAYIDPSYTWATRQQDFRDNFGFVCKCPVCSLPEGSQERRISDKNRGQMTALRGQLSLARDAKEGLRLIERLLQLYRQENLQMPIVTAQLAGHAFGMTFSAGNVEEAKEYARLAAENYSHIFGSEHEKTVLFKQFTESPSKQAARMILRFLASANQAS
eukprot:TRINITY_DN37399_c0_g1_i1.p1 TRINITY_DN37399_c0_g1~~TRINITY_DN37399_c0_g1_i1.p1  ORF type:complete len:392 (+),score=98.98 TRINITY_DN37399_c0_g1_i1:59-1177(+)